MITTENINDITGAKVLDPSGDKIGTVGQVYVNEKDGNPLFATVHTGLFGSNESFVPLHDANFEDGNLRVNYPKDMIKDAPNVDADGALDEAEQDRIFEYYGGSTGQSGSTISGADTGYNSGGTDETYTSGGGGSDQYASSSADTDGMYVRDDTYATDRADTTGHDVSGPNTDDAMTRSEERLHVGTEQVPTERVRLRKHVVTEQQTVNVPVTHEEVRLEREPISEENIGSAMDGPELSEEEHEVTLSAERPVVEKETVPVERIHVGKDIHTDSENVTEDVRREEVELVGAGQGSNA